MFSLTPVPLSKGEGSEMQDKQSLEHIEEFVTIERKISGTIFLKNLRTREYFHRQKAKKVLSDESSKLLIYSNSNQFTMTRGKFYRSQILDKKIASAKTPISFAG